MGALMAALPDADSLDELRAIQREYEAALQVETDPEEKWRLREMLRTISTYIHELEERS